jgi:cell wall-associated NlpC family hydrolase
MSTRAAHLRAKAVDYLWRFINTAYRWAGDGPLFDCSGLMMETLKSVGLESSGTDKTANQLWLTYQSFVVDKPYAGCLLFWFNGEGIATHVEMAVDNEATIGASGGSSKVLTPEDAIRQRAFVKMRPFAHRGQFKAADPFLSLGD